MATVHSKGNVTLSLDDETGSAQVLTTFAAECELSADIDGSEDTAFGDDWRSRLAGLRDWTLTFSGNADSAANASDDVLGALATTVAWTNPTLTISVLFDNGTTTYSAEGILTNYTITGAVEDVVKFSATVLGAGALGRA